MKVILIGVVIGFVFGGPFGALFGGIMGAWVHRNTLHPNQQARGSSRGHFHRQRAQSAFFQATFLVMGRLAKADGRVSEGEIEIASAIMKEMRLSPDQRQAAIHLFNQGKQPSADIGSALAEFRKVAGPSSLVPLFLEIQLQAAYADGSLTQAERTVLQQVCDQLGVSQISFELLHKRFQAQRAYYHAGRSQGGGWARPESGQSLAKAYEVLGVEACAADSKVKRAYRKLMSQHHPDKLMAKGLPEEMMDVAKQKAQEIQVAYDQIREHRKKP